MRGWLAGILWVAGGVGLCGAGEMLDRVGLDFRGQYDPMMFKLVGGGTPERNCRIEKRGLRCSIAASDTEVSYCGLQARFVVRGDFELTGSYAILKLPEPPGGHGAGLKISIKDAAGEGASLQRLNMRGPGNGYSAHRAVLQGDGKPKHRSKLTATGATSGRLRLARAGATLVYLAAEGDSAEFVELHREEFGSGDLTQVAFAAQTGEAATDVDIVWTGLEVRADELVRLHEYAGRGDWRGAVLAVLLAGVVILGAAIVWWRRKSS